MALGLPLAFLVSAGTGAAALTADIAHTHRAYAASPTWTPARNTALAQLMADAVEPSLLVADAGGTPTPGQPTPGQPTPGKPTPGKPKPGNLTDALLAAGDLPQGYVPMPDALKAFSDTGSQIGACDKKPPAQPGPGVPDRPVAPGNPTGPGLPVHPSPRIAVSPPGTPLANPIAPPPHDPVKNPLPKPSDQATKGTGTVRVAFMKGDTGPVLIEAINPAGDRAARDVVAGVADAPRRCPTYDEGKPGSPDALHMATYPLDVPKFGNKAAGVRFEVDLNSPRTTVHGKMIAVSVRGVALTVLLANLEVPDQHELEAITRTAVQKLKKQR
ncbi:hypothetical protein [Actinoplanes sp. L3-i22]|uniref:hypothetical protein n=1 Tax=Actinoplanes sp. L3-i22 TaxID=2836373 RepID=UPI001C773097|nr:hypothetical protein [Actinoplanes sp. L3-i22]BCY06995.1 hypothetical protein L3i22_020830 [Actinoplanes sp. L3-i22]